MEAGTEFAEPGLALFALFINETFFRSSSDGREARVADELVPAELSEDVAESEDADPVALLRARELLMEELDPDGVASGADTDTFFGGGGNASGCCCCCCGGSCCWIGGITGG